MFCFTKVVIKLAIRRQGKGLKMTVPAVQITDTEVEIEKSRNFEKMRKRLESEEREKELLQKRLADLEKEKEQYARSAKKEDDDDYPSNEPYVDPRTLEKKLSRMEQKFEGMVDRKAEEKARSMIEEERRSSYLKENADFNSVMSGEVIQKFADKHPRVAEAILRMPDSFERQRLVYENIKALGIDKPPAPPEPIQNKIDQNKRSPYYAPSQMGTAPYAMQGDFSEAGKKNAYQKMQDLLKNRR